MNSNKIRIIDTKVLFSTLWIFTLLNYLYCDLVGLMDTNLLKQYFTGTVNGMQMTQGFLIGAAILMEIPIAMILLSRILKYRANRWANIIAGIIMTLVQITTLFTSAPTIYYLFFSIIEIATTAYIVWASWKWREADKLLTNL